MSDNEEEREYYPLKGTQSGRQIQQRLDKLEAAMRRLFPGWDLDNACLPDCSAACCEGY